MTRTRFIRSLDYLPSTIAFVAALVAVVGTPGWDPGATGWAKVTLAGWTVLAISTLALIASFLITARDARRLDEDAQRQSRIAQIAKSQLRSALEHMVHPLVSSWICGEGCDAPDSPMDMLDDRRRELLASLNLNSASPYADGSFRQIRWHEMIERAGREGVERIKTTLQIYASSLDASALEAVSTLLDAPFLEHRILQMHDFMLANTRNDADRPVLFFFVADARPHGYEYTAFWKKLDVALRACDARMLPGRNPALRSYR